MHRPHIDLDIANVRNCSSRHGVIPELIVIHDTESYDLPGLADLGGVGHWFDDPIADASAHLGIDKNANVARYVDSHMKAWSCVVYNPPSLNIELIGHANMPWLTRRAQFNKTAEWCAYWGETFNIPMRIAKVAHGAVIQPGIITHARLGTAGGDHHDPGHYPLRTLCRKARKIQHEHA